VEANLDDKGIFLPALDQGRLNIPDASGGTKDELPSTSDTSEPVGRRGDDWEKDNNPAWISIMYGMINATIILPVLMSFGSIIYRDQAFAPYMPVLVKMTVVSGVVHQLCFSMFSSLPFAVGQVQDAGLIFLSQMASRMVDHCKSRGYDDETMLATVTVGLSLSTAVLGICLVILGQLQLAQYVQLLPTW
jgi:MFS superfamily sulfate permease-like transporter